MDRDEVEVHKLAKKRTGPISSHLDRTNLVNKGFIIWLLGKVCWRYTLGGPERARWLHLARSGSQSQGAIWFILPARATSDIIKIVIVLPSSSDRYDAWGECVNNSEQTRAYLAFRDVQRTSPRCNQRALVFISRNHERTREVTQ